MAPAVTDRLPDDWLKFDRHAAWQAIVRPVWQTFLSAEGPKFSSCAVICQAEVPAPREGSFVMMGSKSIIRNGAAPR